MTGWFKQQVPKLIWLFTGVLTVLICAGIFFCTPIGREWYIKRSLEKLATPENIRLFELQPTPISLAIADGEFLSELVENQCGDLRVSLPKESVLVEQELGTSPYCFYRLGESLGGATIGILWLPSGSYSAGFQQGQNLKLVDDYDYWRGVLSASGKEYTMAGYLFALAKISMRSRLSGDEVKIHEFRLGNRRGLLIDNRWRDRGRTLVYELFHVGPHDVEVGFTLPSHVSVGNKINAIVTSVKFDPKS